MWFVRSKCDDLAMPSIPGLRLASHSTLLQDLSVGSVEELVRLLTLCYDAMAPGLLRALQTSGRYAFAPHLAALKDYLLCQRGDFCQALMDALAGELSKPAAHIHRHNLIGNLDVVLKQTVANVEAARRLDVRLLKATGNQSGWEIFSLDYRADSPLNTLLSSVVMAGYTKAFRFIWRLKRCEHLLASAWRGLALAGRGGEAVALMTLHPSLFRLSQLTLTGMMHFVARYLSYLTLGIIDAAWAQLDLDLGQALDLDIYLKSHQRFLDRILVCGIFGRSSNNLVVVDDSGARALQLKLFQLLQLVLSFVKQQSGLQRSCKDLRKLADSKSLQVEARTAKGDWGLSEKEEAAYQEQQDVLLRSFSTIFSDLSLLSQQFNRERLVFLEHLKVYANRVSSYSQLHFLLQ